MANVVAFKSKCTHLNDNEERKEDEEYSRLQAEFDANSQRYTESGSRTIWARIESEHARDAERYIIQNA